LTSIIDPSNDQNPEAILKLRSQDGEGLSGDLFIMFYYSVQTMKLNQKIGKEQALFWVTIIALSICVVYALYSLASSVALFSLIDKILFGSLGLAIWGFAVFFMLVRVGYNLELNLVKEDYQPALGVGLLVTIIALAVGVVLVLLGFVNIVAIAPISILLVSLSVVFSAEFFNMKRVPFSVRLFALALIIGLLFGVIGLLA